MPKYLHIGWRVQDSIEAEKLMAKEQSYKIKNGGGDLPVLYGCPKVKGVVEYATDHSSETNPVRHPQKTYTPKILKILIPFDEKN